MPTVVQLRDKLIDKLKELFQLDQPDLDFGFYRIMHAKSAQVTKFIEEDLLKIVDEAFGEVDEQRRAAAKVEYEKEVQLAKEYGATDPETVPKVIDARSKYEALKDTASAEAEIYDHLYRFFERYYDSGDFLSRRYTIRETPGKAAPFTIPYSGEEVKLHWANADQYYIKTAEHFTNFTFDLRQAKEVRAAGGELFGEVDTVMEPLRVHFKISDAAEGEHGNIKAADQQVRYFLINKNEPVEFTNQGELVVNFEYRPDPEKTGQEGTWRNKRNAETAEIVLSTLEEVSKGDDTAREYYHLLKLPAPTDSDKNRSLLAKYITRYTSRNTMDYFIHKDLGAFLRRELDFYIKNEIMRLDDIENADAPVVETYLAKIKVLRKIAIKLIDFLAQLEDFQKKLWLKKKFVVETNYCITLDRVPEDLYPEIADNEAQHEEWVSLFAIDEIERDITNPGYKKPLTAEFLKANNKLVLDTQFFDENFKDRLLAAIDRFDDQCDGLMVHSENYQALNLMKNGFREQIKCIYIDPPYNAKFSEVLYKNEYKHSTWIALLFDRLKASSILGKKEHVHIVAIDENEQERLGIVLEDLFPNSEITCVTVVHNPGGIQGHNFSYCNDFAYFIFPATGRHIGTRTIDNANEVPLRDWGGDESKRETAKNCFYPIYIRDNKIIRFGDVCSDDNHPKSNEIMQDGTIAVYPIDNNGVERKWRNARNTIEGIKESLKVKEKNGIFYIVRLKDEYRYKTVWDDQRYNSNVYGSKLLGEIQGEKVFAYPKSLHTVKDSISATTFSDPSPCVLDYFAGSGTTAHAVIELNREDSGNRKYILVEMDDYFDTVMKPRIAKVVYSEGWKDGKPTARHTGISHCFKYIRLESYEDTLNNLRFEDNHIRDRAIEAKDTLKEDYMLHYMLDVETSGSQSLLNIDSFADPTAYKLKVKKPGSEEYDHRNVDLVETFNYLIGLRVIHIAMPHSFTAKFNRISDPELPEDKNTKLVVDGNIKQDEDGPWWFRKIEGWVPSDPANPNNGQRENVLIVWRKLTGDLEKDNAVLDEWFDKNRISTRDFEFDTIYVNGSNNLPNLARAEDAWKVRLIEEEFLHLMWEGCVDG